MQMAVAVVMLVVMFVVMLMVVVMASIVVVVMVPMTIMPMIVGVGVTTASRQVALLEIGQGGCASRTGQGERHRQRRRQLEGFVDGCGRDAGRG